MNTKVGTPQWPAASSAAWFAATSASSASASASASASSSARSSPARSAAPRQMVALVPVLGPAPDQPRHLGAQFERAPAPRRRLPEPDEPEDVGLLARRSAAVAVVLHDRIGLGRAIGSSEILAEPGGVADV